MTDSTRTFSRKVLTTVIASCAVAVAFYNIRHSENFRVVFPYVYTATSTIGTYLPDSIRYHEPKSAVDIGEEEVKEVKALVQEAPRIAVVQLSEPVVVHRTKTFSGVQLPKGTRLDVVGASGRNLRVRYGTDIVEIPRASTSQNTAVANLTGKKHQ